MTHWTIALLIAGSPLIWRIVRGMLAGRFASDVVASIAIITAVILNQPVAGFVIVLMQAGGEALERYAEGRASAAVAELEAAAPRIAHRVSGDIVENIKTDDIRVGDHLLVRPGELIPADSIVVEGSSHVDASRLTGEPFSVRVAPGSKLMSGSINEEGAITVQATALASDSQYARIVELVRSAQEHKAPLQRLADKYAVWFTPITLIVCLITYLSTHDPLRILAVLVVATPCPLILATPVAIIGGINSAARRQIIFRNGGALEQLAAVDVAVFDKTGTLTIGLPTIGRVITAPGYTSDELLRLAAAVEQKSGHLLARTVVAAAEAQNLKLPPVDQFRESPGRGVSAVTEGHTVVVGSRAFVNEQHPQAAHAFVQLEPDESGLRANVAIDGMAAGIIEYADQIRPDVDQFFPQLRDLGITRTLLLSGDQQKHTQAIAKLVAIPEAIGELLPEDKVVKVRTLIGAGHKVVMVGDGTNDAPALTAATVGVAMAGHGGGIAAESADVILLADDVSKVGDAIRISRRTLRIARQSIWAGLGLSGVAMVFAAFGMIPPIAGALFQEGVDLAVILNALRASREARIANNP